jgi:hypothetical protein
MVIVRRSKRTTLLLFMFFSSCSYHRRSPASVSLSRKQGCGGASGSALGDLMSAVAHIADVGLLVRRGLLWAKSQYARGAADYAWIDLQLSVGTGPKMTPNLTDCYFRNSIEAAGVGCGLREAEPEKFSELTLAELIA